MTQPDIKKLFGKRIKDLRIKMGLTQEQLSEQINIGERNLSKIECGNVFVKASTIANLAKALNIEAQELFNFSQFKGKDFYKKTLIEGIKNDKIDVELLYKIYNSIKH